MKKMLSGNEIRNLYLNYFKEKHSHTLVESSNLIPDNPTVLLTTAGMLQFVPIFLGYEKPKFSPARATSCQKCARAGGKDSDIENVGKTPRHHTFFEMLGNFSFGDYFKKEIIPWSWDFITNHLKLDKDKLWITIYQDDDEAGEIWKQTGIAPDRILKKGKKDNFWGPPGAAGPCGPCTEIHYDLGEHLKCSEDCGIDTCECDRWVEIWNLVFMELFQDEDGNQTPLENKNVDTGMGLERITMVVQGKTSTFETDLLKPIMDEVSKMCGVEYKKSDKTDISLRIITDHARCVTFLINDGVIPGNEGRNYVLRMILRRALRHGKMLGLELPFLFKLVNVVIENYSGAYPDLLKNKDQIEYVIKMEEDRFKLTLDRGYKLLEDLLAQKKDITGEDAFKLYDTFGFPMELTLEIAQEHGLNVDVQGFKTAMQEQKNRAKAAAQKISLTNDLIYVDIEKQFGATEFVGYCQDGVDAKILATVEGEGFVDIVLDKTPFYAESGGQVGDVGFISSEKLNAEVLNTFKVNKLFVQRCQIIDGEVKIGEAVTAKIDSKRRSEIKIHHTNAHLLQSALIKVLGDEVKQAGSQVEENRTRFDFSFSRAMTPDEVKKAEAIINTWISEGLEVQTKVMSIEEAQKTGATALFGEKYDEEVRVVSVGNISKEFCGGTHSSNTGELRLVKIVSESAIAAGTRRIEAVVGTSALNYLNKKETEIDKLSAFFKAPYEEVSDRVEKLQEENKNLQKQLAHLQSGQAREKFNSFVEQATKINGGKLFVAKIDAMDANSLKDGVEMLGQKLGDSVIVVVSPKSEGGSEASGATIVVKVSDNFVANGIQAGKIVSEIAAKCGGKGGGRPQFAQGGLGDLSAVDKALEEFKNSVN
jgi:alanyl-tRNA synthetase